MVNGHANGTTPRFEVHHAPSWPQHLDDPGRRMVGDRRGNRVHPGRGREKRPWQPRPRRPDGTAFIVVALFAVAQVAVVAFSGSWQHQYELSVHLGQAHWVAGMQPLSVEGLIVSASLVIWYAARYGYRKRDAWGAYLVLAAGVGQTVLMNLGADYRWPWLGPEISVWPAVAFVAAYEMAVWLVRKRQDKVTATATPDATPVATDDSGGDTPTRELAAGLPATTPPVMSGDGSAPTTRSRPKLSVEAEAARDGVSVRTVQRRRAKAAT